MLKALESEAFLRLSLFYLPNRIHNSNYDGPIHGSNFWDSCEF